MQFGLLFKPAPSIFLVPQCADDGDPCFSKHTLCLEPSRPSLFVPNLGISVAPSMVGLGIRMGDPSGPALPCVSAKLVPFLLPRFRQASSLALKKCDLRPHVVRSGGGGIWIKQDLGVPVVVVSVHFLPVQP